VLRCGPRSCTAHCSIVHVWRLSFRCTEALSHEHNMPLIRCKVARLVGVHLRLAQSVGRQTVSDTCIVHRVAEHSDAVAIRLPRGREMWPGARQQTKAVLQPLPHRSAGCQQEPPLLGNQVAVRHGALRSELQPLSLLWLRPTVHRLRRKA
jgi:hypothetical protein